MSEGKRFDLERGAVGVITTPSGRWAWFPVRIYSMPSRTVSLQRIVFFAADHPRDIMTVALAPDVDDLSEEEVRDLARHPDSREITVGDSTWFVTRPSAQEHWLRVRRSPTSGSPLVVDQVSSSEPLGELSSNTLEDLLRPHS